ncbi:MAG TPA: hypothetical protein VJG83_05620 [archaeon]|nr:hypothetical protein [archaeon]
MVSVTRTLGSFLAPDNEKGVEKQRIRLLAKSKELEKKYLLKSISKNDYFEIKSAIHKRMILLDLEGAILKSAQKSLETQEQIEAISQSSDISDLKKARKGELAKLRENRRKFLKNRENAGSFEKSLKEIYSQMLEIESKCGHKKREAQKAAAREIIEHTAKLLGTREQNLQEQISPQTSQADQDEKDSGPILVPAHHKIRMPHPIKKKKKRHVI